MISEDRLKQALVYLSETDEPCAKAKALMESLNDQKKTVKAVGYINSQEKTQSAKESDAYASKEYREHIEKIKDATYDHEIMRNKRRTEELIIDVWRSINSARSKGVL
jgi:hypothetical protein